MKVEEMKTSKISPLLAVGSLFLMLSYFAVAITLSLWFAYRVSTLGLYPYSTAIVFTIAVTISVIELGLVMIAHKPSIIFLLFVIPIILVAVSINQIATSAYVHNLVRQVMERITSPAFFPRQ
jgi:hypothetical protein